MKKRKGAVTKTGRCRRVFAAFAMLLIVISLVSGAEAFAPFVEMDDFEHAPVRDGMVAESRFLGDDVPSSPRHRSCLSEFTGSHFARADSQVVSRLRNSGIQRAAHPTGPPPGLT